MTMINLGVVALASAALPLAGCGGGSSSSNGGVAHLGSTVRSSATAGEGAPNPGSDSPEAAALAYANCMRSGGLPNFPDPSGGGFRFHRGAGIDPSSPAFKAARTKCKKFLPPGPGSGAPPSAQALAKMLTVSRCMRSHGVPNFPDPRTSVPSNLHPPAAGASRFVISDIEGVILLFPSSINKQSPVFTRASAACAFPLHNH